MEAKWHLLQIKWVLMSEDSTLNYFVMFGFSFPSFFFAGFFSARLALINSKSLLGSPFTPAAHSADIKLKLSFCFSVLNIRQILSHQLSPTAIPLIYNSVILIYSMREKLLKPQIKTWTWLTSPFFLNSCFQLPIVFYKVILVQAF